MFRVTREKYENFLIKYSQCMMHINSRINWLNLLISHNEIVITRNSNGHAVYAFLCFAYMYLCTGQLSISRDLFEVINYMMLFRAHSFLFIRCCFFFCSFSVSSSVFNSRSHAMSDSNRRKKGSRTNDQLSLSLTHSLSLAHPIKPV